MRTIRRILRNIDQFVSRELASLSRTLRQLGVGIVHASLAAIAALGIGLVTLVLAVTALRGDAADIFLAGVVVTSCGFILVSAGMIATGFSRAPGGSGSAPSRTTGPRPGPTA